MSEKHKELEQMFAYYSHYRNEMLQREDTEKHLKDLYYANKMTNDYNTALKNLRD